MTTSDLNQLAIAREHLEILHSHLARNDLDDQVVFDAVCMRLSAAIDRVAAIDANVRDTVFGDSWPAIAAVRNHLAHGYISVDRAIITATVEHDLPTFEADLGRIAKALGDLPGQR